MIKVLDFDKYISDECVAVHLKKISVVNLDPGHRFGNPVYYFDVFGEKDDDDSQEVINMTENLIEDQISQELIERTGGTEASPDRNSTLLKMYSCQFAIDQKPVHSKIPSTGWKVDIHGCAPVPRIRWIPGPKSQLAPAITVKNEKAESIIQESSIQTSKFIPLESGGLYAWLLA